MDWPESLIKEIASRRVVFFLGSGISASSANDRGESPPVWKDFLEKLSSKIHDTAITSEIDALIDKEKYLDAAELIIESISKADLTSTFREAFQQPRFRPSEFHKYILKLDPKILITTNYDDIYDQYCRTGDAVEGYNICKYYDDHLVSDIRSPIRIIIKAHGCISDPSKIILAKSQYFKEKLLYPNFFNILNSIFITNTLLFMGYSISDPDIQLILENSNIVAPGSHPHYAILPDNISRTNESAFKNIYNIQIIKYPYDDYNELLNGLKNLLDDVNSTRNISL